MFSLWSKYQWLAFHVDNVGGTPEGSSKPPSAIGIRWTKYPKDQAFVHESTHSVDLLSRCFLLEKTPEIKNLYICLYIYFFCGEPYSKFHELFLISKTKKPNTIPSRGNQKNQINWCKSNNQTFSDEIILSVAHSFFPQCYIQ